MVKNDFYGEKEVASVRATVVRVCWGWVTTVLRSATKSMLWET